MIVFKEDSDYYLFWTRYKSLYLNDASDLQNIAKICCEEFEEHFDLFQSWNQTSNENKIADIEKITSIHNHGKNCALVLINLSN